MLNQISLKNFRGFRDVALPLKPLTMLLGPNSAGKSSFGHALYALHKVNQTRDEPSLDAANKGVGGLKLGRYADLLHSSDRDRDDDRVTIGLRFGLGEVSFGFGGESFGDQLILTRVTLPAAGAAQHSTGAASVHSTGAAVIQTAGPAAKAPAAALHFTEEFERQNSRFWKAAGVPDQFIVLGFRGLLIETAHVVTSGSAMRFAAPAQDEFSYFIDHLSYLRPNRLRPDRDYAHGKWKRIDAEGEATPTLLHERGPDPIDGLFYPPVALPNDTGEARAQMAAGGGWQKREATLSAAVDGWMQHLGLAKAVVVDKPTDRIRVNLQLPHGAHPIPLTDLGFGLSQVLPVLVGGLTLGRGELLIVEQPEAQLHPAPQAELGDFLCALVKSGRNVLVETHSEALFHRIRLRALMDEELEEKTAVYFLDPPGDDGCCPEPRPIPLSEEGEFEWPKKFLTEAVADDIALTSVLRARRAHKEP